ncbi:MAG: PDZ domain-containing protein [Acidimicrobiia bacterium]|nr:PDZ domain-containing protein [Acidimicrobiia bacterium]
MENDEVSVPRTEYESRPPAPSKATESPAGDPIAPAPPLIAPRQLETPAEARRSIRRWVFGMVGFVIAAAVAGGLLLDVPYVALVPGSARDTEPLLAIEGIDEYPSDGELLLLTVRFRTRPNLWEYLWLRMDDDAQVVPEENIFGDRTPEENREFNLELMNDSKRVAVAVALEQLGYDAVQADAVVVQQIEAGEAAEGILEPGDSVLEIDGRPTPDTATLVEILGSHAPGDEIELLVQPFGAEETRDVTVVLGDHPEKPGTGFLGIRPADRLKFNEEFDFLVEIDSGSVGGPSAGLAFTLAVLDQLTEGELTGGRAVAVTGTINAAGQVGPVGGALQKTAVVRDLGVDTFIVPEALGEDELAELVERADGEIDIVPVSTVEEALDALAGLGGDVDAIDEFAAANRG